MESISYQPGDEATVTMVLNTDMVPVIRDGLGIELEMMKGSYRILENGQHEYTVSLTGEKAALALEFVLKMISMSHTQNLN